MKYINCFFKFFLSINTDIFISEVEITMYIYIFFAKALNILNVTPGVVIIPTPTIETFDTFSSINNIFKFNIFIFFY